MDRDPLRNDPGSGPGATRGFTREAFVAVFESAGLARQAEAARAVVRLCEAAREAGGRALLVGGSVRDLLLGRAAGDFDVEVAGLPPGRVEALARQLGKVSAVGRAFAVMKVTLPNGVGLDVSLPRRDSKAGDSHRDFVVTGDPFLSDREAFRRRDFTVNAIGADLLTGSLVDPFGGLRDLRDRVLRVVDPATFPEDPLRALRALQLMARFGLTLDGPSAELIGSMSPGLHHLPKERVHDEWRRLLVGAERPSIGLRAGMELGLLPELHAELAPLARGSRDPSRPAGDDLLDHTCRVVDEAARLVRKAKLEGNEAWAVMLAAFGHDLPDPPGTSAGPPLPRAAAGREEAGDGPLERFLSSLGVATAVSRAVVRLAALLHEAAGLRERETAGPPVRDGLVRRLAQRAHPATLRQLALLHEAHARALGAEVDETPAVAWLRERAEALGVLDRPPADLIGGGDVLAALGCPPGPDVGRIVRLANDLRDLRGLTRAEVLESLTGQPDPAAAVARLEALLRT